MIALWLTVRPPILVNTPTFPVWSRAAPRPVQATSPGYAASPMRDVGPRRRHAGPVDTRVLVVRGDDVDEAHRLPFDDPYAAANLIVGVVVRPIGLAADRPGRREVPGHDCSSKLSGCGGG